MAVVQKKRQRTLAIHVSDADWITVGGEYDHSLQKRVGGHKEYFKPNISIETQSDWVTLSVREAEKMVKTLKKSIKKAKASSDKAAKGAE